MNYNKILPYVFATILCFGISACNKKNETVEKEEKPAFEENWESLSKIETQPEWFKDAKLGIYFHWGVYSVPAFETEWYPRWMYVPNRGDEWGGNIFAHHQETYGSIDKFNYHDFIPMFKATFFDAEEWASLFMKTGAKFAGPVAQHHDGFAMWASKINPWNAYDMGPKKDITGELFKALKARDMKTIATLHHARLGQKYANDTSNWAGNNIDPGWNSHYPYHPDYVTSSTDPKLSKLYGNMGEDEFNEYWLALVNEVVDEYGPDILWYDSWLDQIPEEYQQKMVAHHFNTAISRNQEPIVFHKQEDLPQEVSLLDIEQGGKTDISDEYWMTDITISEGAWSYTKGQTYKDPALVIRNMVDVWSKKGIVLLNISPTADGVINPEQRDVLRAIGDWIYQHQEAVYETRAYSIYGYGDAAFEEGHFGGQSATIKYSKSDYRFSKAKDGKALFIYTLGMPEPESTIEVKHVVDGLDGNSISKIYVVGDNKQVDWFIQDDKLLIQTPEASAMDVMVTVFKVEFK
ncbi:alpha-L-fucosidase [Chondrinema litorale]|uniref:alpha-L-fucosidase n=1 Tax=Chondrinema litorale TaxID=2994555 RepID=UPI002542D0DB|nr:alpha-L-fucosidase [Chondrinema litorale]UZR99059.1 alpha-L-fucosidase [Chondrinema litorale]